MRSKYVPVLLVVISMTAAAIIAIIDSDYRDKFYGLVSSVVVGYWAWMQASNARE